jgi:hypothetical protein
MCGGNWGPMKLRLATFGASRAGCGGGGGGGGVGDTDSSSRSLDLDELFSPFLLGGVDGLLPLLSSSLLERPFEWVKERTAVFDSEFSLLELLAS